MKISFSHEDIVQLMTRYIEEKFKLTVAAGVSTKRTYADGSNGSTSTTDKVEFTLTCAPKEPIKVTDLSDLSDRKINPDL